MARGFSTTLGSATTDKVTTLLTAHATQRSYSIWVNRNGTGGGALGRIFDKRVAGAQVELFNHNGGNYVYERAWSGGSGSWSFTPSTTGVWDQIVVTYDGGAAANDPIFYLNGASVALVGNTNGSGTINTNADAYVLGNRGNDNGRVWDGMLAEFAVWDRILTAAEAAALGKGYSPLFLRASLVEYVPMLRDNGSRIIGAPTVSGTAVQPHPRVIYPSSAWRIIAPTGGATVYPLTAAGAMTPAGAIVRQANAVKAGAATPAGTLVKSASKVFAGAVSTITGALANTAAKVLAGGATPAGALVKLVSAVKAGAITPSGLLVRLATLVRAGGLTPAGTVAKTASTALSGALSSITGALVNTSTRFIALAGGLTPAGTLVKAAQLVRAGAATPSGALVKLASLARSGGLTTAGTLANTARKVFAGAVTGITGALTNTSTRFLALAGSLASSGTLVKSVSASLSGAVTFSGTVRKTVSKALSGALSSLVGALVAALVPGSGSSTTAPARVTLTDSAVTAVTLADSSLTVLTLADSAACTVTLEDSAA